MDILSRLRKLVRAGGESKSALSTTYDQRGIRIALTAQLEDQSVDGLLSATDAAAPSEVVLAAYLAQLVDEGHCSIAPGYLLLPWAAYFDLLQSPGHAESIRQIDVPPMRVLRPILDSRATLADPDFEVTIVGWVEGGIEVSAIERIGAVIKVDSQSALLTRAGWFVAEAVSRFAARSNEHRSQRENELGWGGVRALAEAAGAFYKTPYLQTTIVLTPEKLRLPTKREETAFGRVLTVEPTFDGAPEGWIKAFDRFDSVQGHYDLTPKGGGHTRVVMSEPVKKVLEVIKREMPARKVAGARAERLVHNPWAFLGEAAHEVLDPEQVALDREASGAITTSFNLSPTFDGARIISATLMISELYGGGRSRSQRIIFEAPNELSEFVDDLEKCVHEGRKQLPWDEYDLAIDGDSESKLAEAKQILKLWRMQPDSKILFDDVYQLAGYSDRIEGIGVAKPVYVPIVQKTKSEGEEKGVWVPEELEPMVRVTLAGHDGQVLIPLSKDWLSEFEGQVSSAEQKQLAEVSNASLPTSLETGQARVLLDSFKAMIDAPDKVKADSGAEAKGGRRQRESLLVKLNFHQIDYAEERRLNLAIPDGRTVELPRALRPTIDLKKHQVDGIRWFQHLVSRAPSDCRGALLADDMGLGKTLQLLTILAWYYEKNPEASPSIILAPKSLVDNWSAEAGKFFNDSFPRMLVLYGDELQSRKQPLGLIDEALRNRQVVDLLKPGWAGQSKVVITTYETLTSYEFSLAKQPFSFVICDEAQRIKTPGTQVSLAVRALKADFRIACTGTPVENSLADLWCLFDFVQPGLLGGLQDFGTIYRRPIECSSEPQREALQQLQSLIAPQTLRRTKLDIANELPRKLFAVQIAGGVPLQFKEQLSRADRLEIQMSPHQNVLYLGGLKKLRDAAAETDGRKRARLSFGALHLMKAVCAEPYCLPGTKFLPDKAGHTVHLENSPKLAWLLVQLKQVKADGEKAIVFTELREVQSALFYFLRREFGLKPSVINGDSQNRQAHIERFSASPGFNVIILSTLAAGAGLNITAANHVFHFTRAWNPAKENQATDRAYRIGAKKDVKVYCPTIVSDFTTFDVRLDELLREKGRLSDATIGGSSMESMLNGAGGDVSMMDLVVDEAGDTLIRDRLFTLDDVDRLDGLRFEVLCKLLWSRAGFVSQITAKSRGDGGIDVVAIKGREGELLQCKSSINREVGWDAVKEVATGAALYQVRFSGTRFKKVAVTNQRFTRGAKEHAGVNQVYLIERDDIAQMLDQFQVRIRDVEEEFFAEVGDELNVL